MAEQETIDLTNAEAMREKFKDLSISDLCALLREGLNELCFKLRNEEGFSYDMIISGKLDDGRSNVYITGTLNMNSGRIYYGEMIKL